MNTPTVIYEADDFVVLNKPAGLLVHRDGSSDEATLAEWFVEKYPDSKGVGETLRLKTGEVIARPGIVHRLDKETSGVIVAARTEAMFAHLKEQFKSRSVKKEYRAFVYGTFKEDEGVIDRPIGKSNKDFRQWSAQRGARGTMRDATTEYAVLEKGSEASMLAVFPKTGRTHQIRVHLKAVHHPVVCDALYAPKHPCLFGFSRLALHAYRLTFTDLLGEKHTFMAPLPSDFVEAEKQIGGLDK